MHTGTGDEAKGVVAVLRILPELDVAVVEDVRAGVQVVEGLRRQHHAHIVARVKQRQRLQEEVRVGHLRTKMQPVKLKCSTLLALFSILWC